MKKSCAPTAVQLICFCLSGEALYEYFRNFHTHPTVHLSDWSECMYRMCGAVSLHCGVFFFLCFPHLADSHPSYPPSMCVKREPHEASFAPFTPSSVGDPALADILPQQSSLSVDACTPSYPAHAHGPCYSQAFIAGTALPIRPLNQIKL